MDTHLVRLEFLANIGCTISDGANVTFGDNVFIAPHVSFFTEGHAFTSDLRNDGWEYAQPITVGNNVGYVEMCPFFQV